MRPKNAHIVAFLRQKMSPPLSQKQFAAQFEVSVDLIQGIELGRKKLTERLARRISDQWDVSLDQLLFNSFHGRIERRDGQPWTPEIKEARRRRLERIGGTPKLSETENSLVPLQLFTGQVIRLQDFFETAVLPGNQQAARQQWEKCFLLSIAALAHLQDCDDWAHQNFRTPEQLANDIRRMDRVTGGWAKQMKFLLEIQDDRERDREIMRFCSEWFKPYHVEAHSLLQEEGVQKANLMGYGEFCTRVARKVKKEQEPVATPETPMQDIFNAIKYVYNEKYGFLRRKSKR